MIAKFQSRNLQNFDAVKDSQQDEDNSLVEDGHKYLEEDKIRNAIGKCLQEAAVDGKCTKGTSKSPVTARCRIGMFPRDITNMEKLFYKKWHFNADLSKWDTSHVTNMKKMFYYAFEFSQDLSDWQGESEAENEQDNMFNGASRFQSKLCLQRQRDQPVKTHSARREQR